MVNSLALGESHLKLWQRKGEPRPQHVVGFFALKRADATAGLCDEMPFGAVVVGVAGGASRQV